MYDKNSRILTVPNYFTLCRILFAPLVYYFALKKNYLLAMVIFLLLALTDWADGFCARRFNQGSKFGCVLDPIADKIFAFFSYLAIYSSFKFLFWLVVCRDICILLCVGFALLRKWDLKIEPIFISKVNTAFLFCLPFWWFVLNTLAQSSNLFTYTYYFVLTLKYVIIGTTLASWFLYAKSYIMFVKTLFRKEMKGV